MYRWNELYLRLSIPFSMGSYPNGLPCRAQTTKSYLFTTKTSRAYETVMPLGSIRSKLNTVASLGECRKCLSSFPWLPHAKKLGIANNLLLAVRTAMHQQQDLVAGDFNGAAWRRQSGSDPRSISSFEEALVITNLPLPPGPHTVVGPRGVPSEWSNVCGFLKPPGSENEWQVRMHGAFTIPFGMLDLKETDRKFPSRSLDPPPSR